MKALWVGDSHLKKQHLADGEKFVNQLLSLIDRLQPEAVILAGDQFDTFDTVSSSVLALWTRFFTETAGKTRVIAIVGNHDMAGAHGGVSPMEPFKQYGHVTIVDRPMMPLWGDNHDTWFFPFMREKEEFEAAVRNLPANTTLFCHQSFDGAQFESGSYDPHGADVTCAAHLKAVVSGHVHKQQAFANILYPGTPFQHTFADAGETKAVFEIDLSNNTYTVLAQHVLDMPRFEVVTAESPAQLLEKLPEPNLMTNFKLVAKGAPSEIAAFWREEKVIAFKQGSKRVQDALTSVKPLAALSAVKGSTQKEKLDDFIKSKKWRTDSGKLAGLAAEYLGA